MWTYTQLTGDISHDGVHVGTGYSGRGDGKNNPAKQGVADLGPIPCGMYTIGPPRNTETHGPFVMTLAPDATNQMFGRSGFLWHGDSITAPGTASLGCIASPPAVRHAVVASRDIRLKVVSGVAA